MIKLTKDALDFTKKHIEAYYDSDFFPKPLEFDAIFNKWNVILDYLTKSDVNDYPVKLPFQLPPLKSDYTFRVVHQLDPLNSLIYTSLAYMVCNSIENKRIPKTEKVACSYRINVDETNGTFFGSGNGYTDYDNKSISLSEKYSNVLLTDIKDFYNQVYVHRLQNIIEYIGCEDISKRIETFLLKLNSKTSQGIPVGPAASIIMAEAIMIDIDELIKRSGLEHTRYVDDIRIYGKSEHQLRKFLEQLTCYLYSTHRLTLSSHKTKFLSTEDFISNISDNPENKQRLVIHRRIDALAEAYSGHVGIYSAYDDHEEYIPDTDDPDFLSGVFEELILEVINFAKTRNTIDIGLAHHILRTCKQLKFTSIATDILDNFYLFLPAIRDVMLYLKSVTTDDFIRSNMDSFVKISKSNYQKYEFVRYWCSYYFSSYSEFLSNSDLRSFVFNSGFLRPQSIACVQTKDLTWIRNKKDNVFNFGETDKRSIIYAGQILPNQERQAWLKTIKQNTRDQLDIVFIDWIKSM